MKAGVHSGLLLVVALAAAVVWRWSARDAADVGSAPADTKRPVVLIRGETATMDEARASALVNNDAEPRLEMDAGVEARVVAASGAGNHEHAAALAAEAPEEMRTHLLTAAYHAWARREPEVALDTALMLDDPVRRRVAFHAAASGWAKADPRALAECALAFPEGPERSFAIVAAVRAWRRRDAEEVGRWLTAHPQALAGERERALIAED